MQEILSNPVTDSKPVEGVCEGRIVAYWPRQEQIDRGLRAVGGGGYIPAMITANWGGGNSPMPAANLRLFTDGMNITEVDLISAGVRNGCLGSVLYSKEPAYGCWTWIPKA